jgi:hypothetical protein
MTEEELIELVKEEYNLTDVKVERERLVIDGNVVTCGLLLSERFYKLYYKIDTWNHVKACIKSHYIKYKL